MDHGGEAARPTTTTMVSTTGLGLGGAVQGSEANIGSGAFVGQPGGAAAAPLGSVSDFFDLSKFARRGRAVDAGRGEVPVAAGCHHLHRQPGPAVVAYPNIGGAVLVVGPQLPGGVVVPVHCGGGSYGYYSAPAVQLQPRPGAGRGVALQDLIPGGGGGGGGALDNGGDYGLQQPRPGAGHDDVLVDLLPVPGDDGAGHGDVLVDLLPVPDGAAGDGGRGDAIQDGYGYYLWEPRPGAGRGEVIIGVLPEDTDVSAGGVVVLDGSANLSQQALLSTGRTDGIGGRAVYDDRGMVGGHLLRRLLPFLGLGVASVAVTGLAAAGPGSPAVAFDLFAMFLAGLFLVITHVLRV